MSYGCAKIPRGIRRHKSYRKKPFSEWAAIVDLMLDVTFCRSRIIEGVKINKGQMFVRKRELAKRWGWHVKQVKRFFKKLEITKSEPWTIKQQVLKATTRNPGEKSYEIGTLITFVNYDLFCKSEGESLGEL